MSYSSLLKSLPAGLLQPSGVSIVVSLALHGLVLMSMPLLASSTDRRSDRQTRVSVIELTPAEMQRLPRVNMPQMPLPSETLPTFPNIGGSRPNLLNPALPNPFQRQPGNLSLLPFNPPGSLRSFTPPGITTVPVVPPPSTIQIPAPVGPLPGLNQPQIAFGPLRPVPELDRLLSQTNTPNPPLTPATPLPEPTPSPSPFPSPSPAASPNAPSPSAEVPGTTPAPSPIVSPPSSPGRLPLSPEQLERLRELQARQEALIFNGTGTSPSDANDNLARWMLEVDPIVKGQNQQSPWQQKTLEVEYPVEACPRRLAGDAIVGVVVNAEGKLIDPKPVIIQSTGYKILNDRALEGIKAYTFQPTEQIQPYLITIKFAPTQCPAAS